MKETRYVIEAIDLLMHHAKPLPKPRLWLRILDYALTVLYYAALVFVVFKIVVWLT